MYYKHKTAHVDEQLLHDYYKYNQPMWMSNPFTATSSSNSPYIRANPLRRTAIVAQTSDVV